MSKFNTEHNPERKTGKEKYDELSRAKYAACYYLSRRSLTDRQLREKLEKKEYLPEVINETLEYMTEAGYINDADYAARYVQDALNLKRHGKRRIRQDLRQKGIDIEVIDEVLGETESDSSPALRALIEQKSAGLDLGDRKHRARVFNFLVRRGYDFDEINTAIREFTEGTEDTDFD